MENKSGSSFIITGTSSSKSLVVEALVSTWISATKYKLRLEVYVTDVSGVPILSAAWLVLNSRYLLLVAHLVHVAM